MKQTSRIFNHSITLFLLVFLCTGALFSGTLFFLFSQFMERYEKVLPVPFFLLGSIIFILAALCSWGLTLIVVKRKWAYTHTDKTAYFDELTDLPSQQHFLDRLEEAIYHANRYQHNLAVLFINLDGFDRVNRELGHKTGDQILQHTAECLQQVCRKSDTLTRLENDEFCVLIPRVEDPQDIESIAAKIIATLSFPMTVEGTKAQIGASLGIAFSPKDASSGEALIKKAQAAMVLAKRQGPNQYLFHSDTQPDL